MVLLVVGCVFSEVRGCGVLLGVVSDADGCGKSVGSTCTLKSKGGMTLCNNQFNKKYFYCVLGGGMLVQKIFKLLLNI